MSLDNAVLASVGCEEGLNCEGPKFPLNIIAVVPFAFRGDQWVLDREKQDKEANLPYHQQHGIMSTAISIQQAVGRTTRGPEDYSETYILDENFGWFCRRYRDAFKEDFLRSIRVRA
jgi:Rad3-related DNA helicase